MISMKISLLPLSCLLITLKADNSTITLSGTPPSPNSQASTGQPISTVTTQPTSTETQSSTGITETQSSTGITEIQSSTGTTETQSSTGITDTQSSTGIAEIQSSTGTTETQSSTGTTETQSSTGTAGITTAVQTTQSTPTSSETTGSTPETSVTVTTTSKTSDQTISVTSTGTTTIKSGGRLNSSEMALTVVLGSALGVVVLGITIYTCTTRNRRSLSFTHTRLYDDSDGTVDMFAPPDDTLVISGGLYDGTQMQPVEGDVTADQTFTIQPAQLRLEFLHDAQERTPGNP